MLHSCVRWLVVALLAASAASAVAMDWTLVGDPGNACDLQPASLAPGGCFGSVDYVYYIGTHEVTNAQYVEFLNAKAKSDPFALYSTAMSDPSFYYLGGITRSGAPGNYSYSAIEGRENLPVNNVSFYDAMRFANWMNNGQVEGDTETGAYTLLGGTAIPTNGETVTRNAGATIAVTSEDEWYKAAYYDAASESYFAYPTGHNSQTFCRYANHGSIFPNSANCWFGEADLAAAGAYSASPSPYGTTEQGGNVWEWNEALVPPSVSDPLPPFGPTWYRALRGGGYFNGPEYLAASMRSYVPANSQDRDYGEGFQTGFRISMVPEPKTNLLRVAGMSAVFGLSRWRKRLRR